MISRAISRCLMSVYITINMVVEKKKRQPKKRKTLTGVVVSNKAKDTLVVEITRYVKHPKYKKYLKRMKRYQVHNSGNTRDLGERVTIYETRPISKTKHFELL